MGWLRTLRVNRAAKQYALKLPKQLKDGWGGSEHYTPGQIMTSAKKLGLNTNYIAIAYAAFLPKDNFNELRSEMPVPISYDEARTAFIRYCPINLETASWDKTRLGFPPTDAGGDGY
jgi:hypothetical protein